MTGIEFKLGQIDGRLASIDKRLEDGKENFDDFNARLTRLELVEARRAGVLAAIAGLASILGGLIVAYFQKRFL